MASAFRVLPLWLRFILFIFFFSADLKAKQFFVVAIIIDGFLWIYSHRLNLNKSIFWFCFVTGMLVRAYRSFLILLLDQRETVAITGEG